MISYLGKAVLSEEAFVVSVFRGASRRYEVIAAQTPNEAGACFLISPLIAW